MKKCDCKIMNTLSRYPKVWPWLGVAGYALDGAELVLKHTRWGKMNYKARMLVHGAGAGLLCLGAGVYLCLRVGHRHGQCPCRRDRRGHRHRRRRAELYAR